MWKLPAGLIDKEGIVHRDVIVREMTGHDEELLLSAKGKNFAKVTTKLLAACVTSIGSLKPSAEDIQGLLVGDRNYLLLAVRMASLGEDIEFSVHCPSCKAPNQVTQNLAELKVKELGDATETEFTFKLPSAVVFPDGSEGQEARVRFLTGKDQEELSALGDDSASLINSTLVKSLKSIGAYDKITIEFVKNMTKRNRDAVMTMIQRNAPGVDMNVEVECGGCGARFAAPVGLEGFFVSRVA